jgi:outer membrane protein OmpA-like peptidoglycan-associated protein
MRLAATVGWRPALVAGLFVLSSGVGEARADCTALDGEIRAAVEGGLTEKLPLLNERMLAEPTCPGDYRERTGRVMALATVKRLQTKYGEPSAVPVDEIKGAVKLGRPWQALMVLGDAAFARKDHSEAVRAYEAAIEDIRDEALNPKAPPKEVEVRLFKRAYQARALSDGYVEVATTRGGRLGGIANPRYRSFTVSAVPVPIRFGYNESVLTEDGIKAAADMQRYLDEQGIARLRLIGHTDPVGGEAYNLRLSKARAEAVKAYLAGNGYKGEIEIAGEGERQPFEPDDPSAYSEDERHAFDRRVEFVVE